MLAERLQVPGSDSRRGFEAAAGAPAVRSEAPPGRISLDEGDHRVRELVTVSGVDRGCIIEVIDGRTPRTIGRNLRSLPAEERESAASASAK
jgi:hypothetical protein